MERCLQTHKDTKLSSIVPKFLLTELIDGSGRCHKKNHGVINNDEAQYSGSDRPCSVSAGTANAAEIYNKDGNKVDL